MVDKPTSMAIMSEGIGFDDTRAILSNGPAIQTGGVGCTENEMGFATRKVEGK